MNTHRSSHRAVRTARLFGLMVTGFGAILVAAAVLPASAASHAAPTASKPAKSCGNYCALPSPTTSQNKHPDGSVGNADNKNPKGQASNGSDHNKGYECDKNGGIGNGNPAHTVNCTSPTPSRSASPSPSSSRSSSPSPSPSSTFFQSVSPTPSIVQSASPEPSDVASSAPPVSPAASPLAGNGGGGATAGKPVAKPVKKPVAGGGGGAGQAKVLPFTGSRTNLLLELGLGLLLAGVLLSVAARPRRVIIE